MSAPEWLRARARRAVGRRAGAAAADLAADAVVAQLQTSVWNIWDEQCAGNKNADVCESCRAYGAVIELLGGTP